MACCAVRAPSPAKEPVPAPAKDENRDGQTITLSSAKSLTGDRGQGSLFARGASDDNRALAEATLQAKHVRIDA